MEKLFCIKIGGNVIDNSENLNKFLFDFSTIQGNKMLIHGGGKIATRIGEQLNIASKYVGGRRITDDATIDLVTMVYGGLVNKKIVAQLQALNCNAIGLTGADGNIIPAQKRPVKEVDFGWVGDITYKDINVSLIASFINNKLTPVFSPLTHDRNGHILNTNADTIASCLAVALSNQFDVRLMYCFEKRGVLEYVEDDNSVINVIDSAIYQQLRSENKLFDGIIPKIDNAFDAINAGVNEVLIGHADDVIQNTGFATAGTLIKA